MLYSQETLQTAFTANAYPKALHREMLTVGEAEESQLYEQHKDMHHEEEMKKFMTMHSQEQEVEETDDFRVTEDDLVK